MYMPERMANMTADRKIIIDCDPGTDDAIALLLASVYLREEILCVLSSYGNSPSENTYANLLGLAELLHFDSRRVFRGSSYPVGKDGFDATDYHGANGLCGIVLPYTPLYYRDEDGIAWVYNLMKDAGEVVYIALGPLTNLAELLERYPDAERKIGEVVIMGGGFAVGNTECGAEYNFSLDPAAVSVVFRSSVKKLLVPLDLTHTLALNRGEIEEIVGKKKGDLKDDVRLAHDVFGRILYGNLENSLKDGNEGAIIHDGAAVACLCSGCTCFCESVSVISDRFGRVFTDTCGNQVRIVKRMSKAELIGLMKKAFRSLMEGNS